MDKKEAARLLYMDGWAQVDICRILAVSDTTVGKWVADGDWKHKRTMQGLFEQTSVEAIRELADYQLRALLHLKDEYVKAGDFKLIDKGEFDALSKAFANIRGPEMKWEKIVQIIRRFLEFVEARDSDLAKLLLDHGNDYLNEIRKTLQ